MGASFGVTSGGALPLFIAAPLNGSSIWLRLVDDLSGSVLEPAIAQDLLAITLFLSPRLYLYKAATAAAVAYDCSGVYVETDY